MLSGAIPVLTAWAGSFLGPATAFAEAPAMYAELLTVGSFCAELQHDTLLPGEAPETAPTAAMDFSQQHLLLQQMRVSGRGAAAQCSDGRG